MKAATNTLAITSPGAQLTQVLRDWQLTGEIVEILQPRCRFSAAAEKDSLLKMRLLGGLCRYMPSCEVNRGKKARADEMADLPGFGTRCSGLDGGPSRLASLRIVR